mgnify:FL=1
MMEQWEKISYSVQLIAACGLFMIPCRKRERFVPRAAFGAFLFAAVSYLANSVFDLQRFSGWNLVYWAAFLAACLLLVRFCLDMTWLQGVYCAVFACAMQHVAFDVNEIYNLLGGEHILVQLLIYAGIYGLFYHLFAKKIPQQGEIQLSMESMFPMVTIFLIVWILSVLETSGLASFQAPVGSRIFYRIIDGLCCFYVLWVQVNQKEKAFLKAELDGINNAWNLQKEQYVIKQELIDNINRKCHDLKHQLRALRQMTDEEQKEACIRELEHDVMLYDTAVDTGNKALDVILMDRGLFCKNNNIQWTCMADGSKLGFMRLEDIYAVFGNALDNAITAVMKVKDPQKRVVTLKMITQNHILVIQIENYFEAALHFEQGLPLTTKHNPQDHGFGMKSIRYVAEKYGGTMAVNAAHHIFTLQILIPLKEAGE